MDTICFLGFLISMIEVAFSGLRGPCVDEAIQALIMVLLAEIQILPVENKYYCCRRSVI